MKPKESGFTLIEVLVVLTILCILSTVVFPIYTDFQNELVLKTTATEIMSALHLAQ